MSEGANSFVPSPGSSNDTEGKLSRTTIALVSAGEIFGGAERQIVTLLAHLDQEEFSPILIVFHDRELAKRCRAIGIPVVILGVKAIVDRSAIQRLRSIIKEQRLQILHIHGYRAAVYAALATRGLKDLQVIKTEHGAVESHAASFHSNLRPRIYRWLENKASRTMSASIVYVTRDLRDKCLREHSGAVTQVIYNGVDIPSSSTATRSAGFLPGYRHLLVAGRLEPVKGVDIAIRSMSLLRTQQPVLLHIAGEGPSSADLESLAASIGVADRVRFHGFQRRIDELVASSDCVLMPSLHEGLPYSLLEAMSLRVPVIASRVGGLAEVLTHRETAFLVPPRSAESLAAAIDEVLINGNLSHEMSRRAYDLVTSKFTAEAMALSYAQLYRQAKYP